MRFARRAAAAWAALAGLAMVLHAPAAWAEWTPNKPLRLVSPYSAGGTNDLLARLIAQKMGERMGQPVVVENRAGANGIIGTDAVAKAPADGYTLLMGNSATHGINPALYTKLPYDANRDFTPIGLMATVPLLLVVSPATKIATVKDLVADARGNPRGVSVASPGAGSSPHLASELFRSAAGIDTVHIAYKGDSPALADVMGGQVTMMFANLPSALPFVQSGKLTALAMTGTRRAGGAPEIPTMAEAGVPGVEISSWYGVMAPGRLPADVRVRLEAEFEAARALPEVQQRIRQLGAEPATGNGGQFQKFVAAELDKYARVVKDTGIKLD